MNAKTRKRFGLKIGLIIAVVLLVNLFLVNVAVADTSWTIVSPDSSIVVTLTLQNDGKLFYEVKKDSNTILESSQLGINTNVANFYSGTWLLR